MQTTKEKIIIILEQRGKMSASEFVDILEISRQALFKHHLTPMVKNGVLQKVGTPPYVFYVLQSQEENAQITEDSITIDQKVKKIIDNNFLYISARGEKVEGWHGFVRWCEKRKFDVVLRAGEYVKIYEKYDALRKGGVISGKVKMQNVFGIDLCLEDVFYADLYAWEIFGKTKRGQLLLYAKQSQDKKMIIDVAKSVQHIIETLIKEKNIEAVGFIAPTVQRQVQFMKVFEKALALTLPHIEIIKIKTEVITPQKTLNKLDDRIENANYTFHVVSKKYNHILLIDDAVGSGATLNQVACKVKKSGNAKRVYGFAIVGSAKGFDVISEV